MYNYGSLYGQYGSLASYFGQSGGTGSPGKAGGAGYNNDIGYSSGQGSVQGDTQQASASSGSGWISAAASTDSTDKSNFSTPFQQGFGGIANNQVYVIGSPGAGVTSDPSVSPITGPPNVAAAPVLGGVAGGVSMSTLLVIVAVVLAAKFVLK